MQTVRIDDAAAGQRLDRFLRKLLHDVPLGAIFRHLRTGRIRVDGGKAKPDLRLGAGMVLTLRVADSDVGAAAAPAARPSAPPRGHRRRGAREPAPRVVFRDQDVMVVDKPAGMAAQPGTGLSDRDLCTWLLMQEPQLRTPTFAPTPAHRLDRGTSGLCAIGLSPRGLRGLAAAFRGDQVHKVYLAIVHGVPKQPRGSIAAALRPVPHPRSDGPKMAVVADDAPGALPARTDWEVQAVRGDRAVLRLVLHSGRQHQIRAHLAHLGHPIVGDRRYGSPLRHGNTFLLHAHELSLPHPVTGEPLQLAAPPPAAFGG